MPPAWTIARAGCPLHDATAHNAGLPGDRTTPVKPFLRPTPGRAGWLLAATLLVLALPAQAQSYRCSNSKGTYYSERPCPADGSTKLGGYGPAPEAQPDPYQRPSPATLPVARAPDHLSYMSPECASLNDGVRTAASRGLAPSTQADLRNDYARRCSADESQARQRWAQDQHRGYRSQRDDRHQASLEARREQAQVQQLSSQCAEMRRIIAAKNERIATLTPGEVADLRRFEGNFTARCVNRMP